MSAVLTAPTTPDDLLNLPDGGRGFELVHGELKERNVSTLSTFVAGELFGFLRDHVRPRRLGWCFPEGHSYRCFPFDDNHVRNADVSFHRLERMTAEQARTEGHCPIVPDLVAEVISPNDLAYDVNEKRIEWLEAGVQLVWVIDPVKQTIHAYRADGTVTDFRRTHTLTGEPVLPDFQVPVADLFRLPTETA